ncbi:MAG: DUF4031 domain-containing protein [Caulobacterales bacterium]
MISFGPMQPVTITTSRITRIYVDEALFPFRGRMMAHMFSPHLEALHEMAERIGMRKWFQDPMTMNVRWPHYDVPSELRLEAIQYGAIAVNRYQTVVMADYIIGKPLRQSEFPKLIEAQEWLRQELDMMGLVHPDFADFKAGLE